MPQFAPGYSPIAFNPADGLPNPLKSATPGAGASSSTSGMIAIIAAGTRKGVAEGIFDFWQNVKALGGKGAAPGGPGGVMLASFETGGGGTGGGALAGVTPSLPAFRRAAALASAQAG